MTRIILVRHGETTWNLEGRYQGQIDTDLSERGREQARLFGLAMKNVHIDAVFASPLKRAYDTAKAAADHHGLQINIVEDLTEIAHGEWEGLLADDVKGKYADLLEAWQKAPHTVLMPQGENLTMVQERAMRGLNGIVKEHPNQTIMVVSHDATNKAIICGLLGIDLKNFWQIKQDNTCLNVIDFLGDSCRIALLNDTCHLGSFTNKIEQAAL